MLPKRGIQAEQRVYAKINQYDLQDGMLERVLVSRQHNAAETERKGCQIRRKNASRIQQNQKSMRLHGMMLMILFFIFLPFLNL